MNGYGMALFLHIVGAVGLFVALGLEWTGLWQIRNAVTADPVRAWIGVFQSVRKFGFAAMLATVITGLYMMLTAWGMVAWISVSLGALVLAIALSVVLTGPRMTAIGRALSAEKGPVSQAFHNLASHPLLWLSIQSRVAMVLGIVFLKIAKPDLGGSLLTMGVAIALGAASALPGARRERPAGRVGRLT